MPDSNDCMPFHVENVAVSETARPSTFTARVTTCDARPVSVTAGATTFIARQISGDDSSCSDGRRAARGERYPLFAADHAVR